MFPLLQPLITSAILIAALMGGMLYNTTQLLDSYSKVLVHTFEQPATHYVTFEGWHDESMEQSLHHQQQLQQSEWRSWLIFPGFRHPLSQLHNRMGQQLQQYQQLLDEMEILFADNTVLKESWERLALNKPADELHPMEVGNSLLSLVHNFNQTSGTIRHYIEFQQQSIELKQQSEQIRQALTEEWRSFQYPATSAAAPAESAQ